MNPITPAKGLKGVVVDTTKLCLIDAERGVLVYRGYDIHDLATHSNFEEVAYLLLYSKLPMRKEYECFCEQLRQNRSVPDVVVEIIERIKDAPPMDVLRTAVSALGAIDPDSGDNSSEATLRKGIKLIAQLPTIVATHERLRRGLKPVEPNPKLSHAANFLYMMRGKPPTEEEAKAIDLDLLLHAEHSSNASAFAVRVTASTLADIHAAIVAGIAALKGPLHGGAAEAVADMALEVGSPERAYEYVREKLARKERIMGFGHRVYRTEDPRARHMRELAKVLSEKSGDKRIFETLLAIEEAMKPLQSKGIYVNVDFYCGCIYYFLGIPKDMYVCMFALGRIVGWVAHALEQYNDNVLIRPLLHYDGPTNLRYIPMDER
ncbi:MAG: citrate/2-methylcitrate synthase [Armatimonadota bacterium]|nr:citrate (Si)-synthase [Armatimonadota bacterium]MCX7778274.1 citrate (Si)-synthase [Armatimonadota bacterium]MDW8026303.1 citrate/2-methylcitrate synthase [Armatimonadota bacterium]